MKVETFLEVIIGNLLHSIERNNREIILHVSKDNLLVVIHFLKQNSVFKFEQLVDITAIHYLNKQERFDVVYQLLSVTGKGRLRIKVSTDELTPIESISHIYPSAGWYEREVWDLFGVFFINNPDLRRILNDYGFKGHPFRKDFPITGYLQVRYDDEAKRVVTEPVEFSSEIRIFNHTNITKSSK